MQDQLSFFADRLQVSLSGRGQFFRLERPEFEATGVSNNYGQVDLVAPPKALTGGCRAVVFHPGCGTKFRVHAGNAYRAPGLYERFGGGFYRDTITDQLVFTPYGDPFLAPDRYNSIDGGFDQYLWGDRARVSATSFHTRIVTVTAFDNGSVIHAGSIRTGAALATSTDRAEVARTGAQRGNTSDREPDGLRVLHPHARHQRP